MSPFLYKNTTCVLFLWYITCIATTVVKGGGNRDGNRLLDAARPRRYEISLRPEIYGEEPPDSVEGRVVIEFECLSATDVLRLHSKVVHIQESSIQISLVSNNYNQPLQKEAWDSSGKDNVKAGNATYVTLGDGLSSEKDTFPRWTEIKYLDKEQAVDIHLERNLISGNIYKIKIDYTAKISPATVAKGLYWVQTSKAGVNR